MAKDKICTNNMLNLMLSVFGPIHISTVIKLIDPKDENKNIKEVILILSPCLTFSNSQIFKVNSSA